MVYEISRSIVNREVTRWKCHLFWPQKYLVLYLRSRNDSEILSFQTRLGHWLDRGDRPGFLFFQGRGGGIHSLLRPCRPCNISPDDQGIVVNCQDVLEGSDHSLLSEAQAGNGVARLCPHSRYLLKPRHPEELVCKDIITTAYLSQGCWMEEEEEEGGGRRKEVEAEEEEGERKWRQRRRKRRREMEGERRGRSEEEEGEE